MLTPSADELVLLTEGLGLPAEIQRLYDQSRAHAQASDWAAHLQTTTVMIPALFLLGLQDWIARIYGRMGWSCVRLHQQPRARALLNLAESYDDWQAAANYYWASEYSHRSGDERFARECLDGFRRVCRRLGLGSNDSSDLQLAVEFYGRLSDAERQEGSFAIENNQSDIGRYLELRARLKQDPFDFKRAADHYELAGLRPYAAGCRVFWLISDALLHEPSERSAKYEQALEEMDSAPIFADTHIRDLLHAFVTMRVLACQATELAQAVPADPALVEQLELKLGDVYAAMFEPPEGDPTRDSLARLAAAVPSLGLQRAWSALIEYIDDLSHGICPVTPDAADELTRLLDGAQRYLPSLSFLVTINDEEHA